MKPFVTLYVLLCGLIPFPTHAQLNNGGLYAAFGIDADTRSNYMKYGVPIASDDWFSPSASGYNVIDTTNAAAYLSLLQAGNNISFSQRMSVPLYTKVNGKLWLDAAYGRDFVATASLKDSTAFTTACKNGDNPSTWTGGITNFPAKDDLLDCYAHMRRDGSTVNDSLWLFTGVSTYGTSGARYYDIELYKNSFTYNAATGVFSTAGPDAGHTQWLFDAAGNITQTGDIIVAVNFSPGSAPVVDIRIWVKQTTWSTVSPAHFSFNSNFSGSTYGYASIVSKTGSTAFGAGLSNYSATATQDTTYATPWGSNNGTSGWSTQYESLQFIEVGLNVTRIGLDPALYTALGPSACASLFSNIFFKSRSSNSFTSNMQDFVIPLVFLRTPVMDYALVPDTLRCNNKTGTIQINNSTTTGYYTWATSNGDIVSANSDSSQLKIDKPGTYILSASPAQGCPATRKDTIVIPIDTFPPVASVNILMPPGNSYLQLYGGNPTASNYATPFGGSKGLLYDWTGPAAFTSTIQNPRTADTTWGTYKLTVTEKRNGCTRTASQSVSRANFIVLLANDPQPAGLSAADPRYRPKYYLTGNVPASAATSLIANSEGERNAVIACYDINGEMLWRKPVHFNKGLNSFYLAGTAGHHLATRILAVYVDGKMDYVVKLVK
ncbi:hypothetical protein Q4E93_19655 [Flavitalea sp. BT771]|uniref:hypothetical protein n=1 Tax=Flavitalea sp. BT771 TaxID=3063329 RepID=UPI0026E38FA1|nr:hypothetical protein [Flavitalea sp. BT771]MDO6432833.1 hypothetical protein [Flavitalea sp. BT771]MDV6221891.1 hypothetical protein [Flavitalea sp. BT771]